MTMKKTDKRIIFAALACCAVMALIDGILRPGYLPKSICKIALFFFVPYFMSTKMDVVFLSLLRPRKQGVLFSVLLGLGVYAVILGGYALISPYFDFSAIAGNLTQNAGVTKNNFLYVSLYISFVNSLLEELFFRGFLFTNLTAHRGRTFAHLFSAILFALYHVAMMIGWFSPALFLLVLAGLALGGWIFNRLNEKLQTIFGSWLTHMFANFAINTIGFLLLNAP